MLTDQNDFGDGFHMASTEPFHMASTEPFFYDSTYKLVKKKKALPIDTNGRCITAKNVIQLRASYEMECSSECKILSDSDVCTIIDFDIIFAGGAWIFKNEQRSRDGTGRCCPKKANTSGVGKSNNYEDIYIPPYSNTH